MFLTIIIPIVAIIISIINIAFIAYDRLKICKVDFENCQLVNLYTEDMKDVYNITITNKSKTNIMLSSFKIFDITNKKYCIPLPNRKEVDFYPKQLPIELANGQQLTIAIDKKFLNTQIIKNNKFRIIFSDTTNKKYKSKVYEM